MTECISWSSRRPILDRADDCRQHGACHAATCDLADNAADVRCGSAIGKQRNQRAEKLSPGSATDCARDGISKRTEIELPATLPPTAPLMIWMMRLMMSPDMTQHSRVRY
jgi:hypothetical protein